MNIIGISRRISQDFETKSAAIVFFFFDKCDINVNVTLALIITVIFAA